MTVAEYHQEIFAIYPLFTPPPGFLNRIYSLCPLFSVFITTIFCYNLAIMAEHSFDIVSEVDLQFLDNALNVARKEIENRYDFRGSNSTIELKELIIILRSADDYKVKTMADILLQKAIKQGVDPRFFDLSKEVAQSLGGTATKEVPLRQGIDKEYAKKINNMIKDMKLKVNSQIQGDQVRVTSKDIDSLQTVMKNLQAAELEIALIFKNFR